MAPLDLTPSIDGVRFSIQRHNFKTVAMTSSHAGKCGAA